MTSRHHRVPLLFTLLAWLLVSQGAAFATTQTRGIFVSPQTGVSVGSVWGDTKILR